jgi:hypothetical protein
MVNLAMCTGTNAINVIAEILIVTVRKAGPAANIAAFR